MVSKQAFNVLEDVNLICDGQLLKQLAGAALAWLEQNHQHVNHLNVFPVPDGDTGTNMLLTMREAYHRIADSDDTHAGHIAAALADGALHGARGNSGTILSQLWQGFASGLGKEARFDAELFASACQEAVRMAYIAVSTPTEGTILTVAREGVAAMIERVRDEGERDLVAALKTLVFAARASLRHTPELLPVLKQAGVVDSGGQGLVYILEGMLLHLTGKSLIASLPLEEGPQITLSDEWQQALEPDDDEGYGYDVQFRMHGDKLNVEAVRKAIEEIGWSTCVVGNERLVKVHVHVHDPSKPIGYAIGMGIEIDDVVVENMQMQYQQYVKEREVREAEAQANERRVAVIAVAPGAGFRKLFVDGLLAARVITGGQTMNPSTGDFLEQIDALPNDEIILLPNNKNIYLAAQQAANLAQGKRVRVVATRTLPQGISAMLAYGDMPEDAALDEVADEMTAAVEYVTSAEITTATRDVEIGGVTVRAGQLIGLLEGALIVAGENMVEVMRDLLRKAAADKRELITLYYGNDTHKAKAQVLTDELAAEFPKQRFEIVYGGQALYPYIISIE
jgi:uncharacterized protein